MKANFYNKKKIKYINMLKSGKPKRNSRGEIVKEAVFQRKTAPVARVESTRSLFNDSKTVSQNELEAYRNTAATTGPYDVLLSTGNVPYSMITNEIHPKRSRKLTNFFGSKGCPKKPRRIPEDLFRRVTGEADEEKEEERMVSEQCKGQSKRIWNELYKVLDSSDVIVQVLDARDPLGTSCRKVEEYVSKQAKHKHLMYILNKVDLVPTSVTAKWLRILSKSHTAVAFHANSIENFYGKSNLINIFRQLKNLYEKPTMSIGFVGYPNVGKSSIINALRESKVCKVAPVPGETKVWQYVTLMNGIYLIDCPGIVPISDYRDAVLHGAIRIENLVDPDCYIPDIIQLVGKSVLERMYGVRFVSVDDLFEQMGRRFGRLLKGGVANVDVIAKLILHDWVRGNIPYFKEPPEES